jgi:signal transduction histidine kinase
MNSSDTVPLPHATSPVPSGEWPSAATVDSTAQRVRAVNAAHLVGGLLIVLAVGTTLLTDARNLPLANKILLITCGGAFVAWFILTRGILIARLPGPVAGHRQDDWQRITPAEWLSFTVHLGLVGTMFFVIRTIHGVSPMWMVVLPMIAHGTVLLPRWAVAMLIAVSLGLLMHRVVVSYGWNAVPEALPQFALAFVFTIVFTQIAVRAERSRAEVTRLASELQLANRKLGEYAVQAEELSATRERNRMAREIHDTVGHVLTVVNVQLEAARAMLDRDEASARDALDKAQALTQQGLGEIRTSVAALRASPLENRSLPAALEQLVAANESDGRSGELIVRGTPRPLSPAAALSLYRVGQEGLTNTRKHAAAQHVKLILDYQSTEKVRLSVIDDGCGSREPIEGYGLLGLRERATLLGGTMTVKSSPGRGFELSIEAPA